VSNPNRTKWIVIGVVAVLIVAGVTALIVLSVPNVTMTGINLRVQGPSAGACVTTLTIPVGPYVYLRSSYTYGLVSKFDNSGVAGSICSITTISTNSSGWSTVGTLTTPVLVCGGSSAPFALSFRTPSGPYYGPLTIDANATYAASNPACPVA
jgi:hypothetical protein